MEDAFSSSTRVIIAVHPVNRLLVARQKKSRVEGRVVAVYFRRCVWRRFSATVYAENRKKYKDGRREGIGWSWPLLEKVRSICVIQSVG